MNKRFSDYLREELESCYLLEGLFAYCDLEKIVGEIKQTIGNKIKETNYSENFEINVQLNESLEEYEKKKLDSVLKPFGYSESFLFLDKLYLRIVPIYPVKIGDQKYFPKSTKSFIFKL